MCSAIESAEFLKKSSSLPRFHSNTMFFISSIRLGADDVLRVMEMRSMRSMCVVMHIY